MFSRECRNARKPLFATVAGRGVDAFLFALPYLNGSVDESTID